MSLSSKLQTGLIDKASELIITDEYFNILYRNHALDFDESTWAKWTILIGDEVFTENVFEWETTDRATGKYYKSNTYKEVYEEKTYLLHHIYDVTDYAELIKDLSKYSHILRNASDCQGNLIKNLSSHAEDCLSVAVKYFDVDTAVLYLERPDHTERFVMKKGAERPETEILPAGTEYNEEGFTSCCSGKTVTDVGYNLLITEKEEEDHTAFSMLVNEFRFYIENALMQEAIIFESEHDRLTGLFNKGKFIELQKNLFEGADSITVYNMDVNYLKRTNDLLGHRAGDALIKKAADSIKAVTGHNTSHDVYGFRTGGDEFIVIAVNKSLSESEEILKKWRDGLDELNRDDGPECIIACGMCHKNAPFSFNEVFSEADNLMYEEKRAIKISRGEDPDGR
ncbi:MAG: GGDEF domain-containing protein [Clostridia bacterium]|nr:GGDEF domain-containing protein [Clostridia bacterium]